MTIDVRCLGQLVSPTTNERVPDPNKFLQYVRVVHPSAVTNEPFRAALQQLADLTVAEVVRKRDAKDSSDASINGWLQAVPKCLRSADNLEEAVEYLGMLVSIDYRHWDEPPGVCAKVGDVVEQAHFYAVIKPSDAATAAHAEHERPTLVRGSAAMVHLLREAVDTLGLRWYDTEFLTTSCEQDQVRHSVLQAFLGVQEDGITPMMMPAAAERLEILRSIAKAKKAAAPTEPSRGRAFAYDTFLQMILRSGKRLFSSTKCQPSAASPGFLDQLIALHPRYDDTGYLSSAGVAGGGGSFRVHLLKLAQLTAIAIQTAFPGVVTFVDEHDMCVCSDYQLPKALRLAGIITYNEELTDDVDSRRLLEPFGRKELEIRIASTIGAAWLREWMEATCAIPNVPTQPSEHSPLVCDIGSLDYALWLFGRTCKTQNHHLCRTIMY